MSLSVLIPAHNEAALIGDCLRSVYENGHMQGETPAQIIVIANGCTDDTVAKARVHRDAAGQRGWSLVVIDEPKGGKVNALMRGEAVATGEVLVYLDADVTLERGLLRDLHDMLATSGPRYASGTLHITNPNDPISYLYRRYYETVPFMTQGVQGCGLFAMNKMGRARFGAWPDIISDDTFARLSFAPHERVKSARSYDWPVVRGWGALVKVRRRQDAGVREIEALYPSLLMNADSYEGGARHHLIAALKRPLAFGIYAAVALATRLGKEAKGTDRWTRGR